MIEITDMLLMTALAFLTALTIQNAKIRGWITFITCLIAGALLIFDATNDYLVPQLGLSPFWSASLTPIVFIVAFVVSYIVLWRRAARKREATDDHNNDGS